MTEESLGTHLSSASSYLDAIEQQLSELKGILMEPEPTIEGGRTSRGDVPQLTPPHMTHAATITSRLGRISDSLSRLVHVTR